MKQKQLFRELQKDVIVSLQKEGFTISDIARVLRMSDRNIYRMLKEEEPEGTGSVSNMNNIINVSTKFNMNKPKRCPIAEWDVDNIEKTGDKRTIQPEKSKCFFPAVVVRQGNPEDIYTPGMFRCPETHTGGGDYTNCDLFSIWWWYHYGSGKRIAKTKPQEKRKIVPDIHISDGSSPPDCCTSWEWGWGRSISNNYLRRAVKNGQISSRCAEYIIKSRK